GRVNKTLVFFTHLFCSKNELSVRSRTVGPQTPSVFRTHETDRTSLSCIVMQRPENDSDAFFWFGLVFSCLFAFFAPESD
ncbi:hypothetical protein, partial [Escherichia coli]|uniref:hypothetical protein n=1 Tax=Escherichia coli TaxID=562 RepID=UPI0011E659BD